MKQPDTNSPWRAAGLTTAIGLDLVVCLLSGYFLGNWLSDWTNGSYLWVIGGVISGIFIALLSIITIIKSYGELK